MKDWNSIYAEKGVLQENPSPRVESAIRLFKEKGFERVLDLGCGTGRHIKLLLEQGLDAYGCDSSENAVGRLAGLVEASRLRVCDMAALPYRPDFFDGIICNHVIQHGLFADAKKVAGEILRVLRPDGILFLTTISTEHPKYGTGREIEPNTRIDTDAIDGHIPHHFFTQDEMRELFQGFVILRLEHFSGPSELDATKHSAAWKLYARKL